MGTVSDNAAEQGGGAIAASGISQRLWPNMPAPLDNLSGRTAGQSDMA